MNKFRLLFCILLISSSTFATDHFWIGGAGNWSNTLNWSYTSGGLNGASVPGVSDNAIFDASSGLTAGDLVTIDVPAIMNDLNFSGVPISFVFASPLLVTFEVQGSIIGNANGVTFNGTWGEIKMNTALTGEVITSLATTWIQDFRFSGEQVSIADDFNIGAGKIHVDAGGIDVNNITVTCSEFHSITTEIRDIDITNTIFNVTDGLWQVDNTSSSLVWTASGSSITLGDNLTIAQFYGGNLSYDTLYSSTATEFRHYGNNSFDLLSVVTSSQFKIENGTTLSTDSLVAGGVCGAPLFLSTTVSPGASAIFTKTGYNVINLIGLNIAEVNTGGVNTYNLALSSISNTTGWDLVGANYYWIGDGGNWNDGANWSLSTNGVSSGCIPTLNDAVFFDANSFSLTGQTVVVDDAAFFKTMDWTGIFGNQTFKLDSSAYAYGNVTLHPNLTVNRTGTESALIFKDQAELSPNTSTIDCSFYVNMDDPADSLLLMNNLVMNHSSSIAVFNGELYTQGNEVKTGSLFSLDNTNEISDLRKIDLGSSFVELIRGFYAKDDQNLTFESGTSHLYIGDTVQYAPDTLSYENRLITPDLAFYDVTLNYQPLSKLQLVTGNNTYNDLTVVPGSRVHLEEGSTQTVAGGLLLNGNCQNTITIAPAEYDATTMSYTTTANTASLIKQNTVADFVGQGLVVQQIDASAGLPLTTYHSVDSLGNSNWVFSSVSSITAGFTAIGPYCFGDTTEFINTSSTTGSITYSWLYNDGSSVQSSTGLIQANNATTLNFSQDPGIDTTAYAQISSWTEIADAQSVFTPASGSAITITGYEAMNYSFTVAYRMALINGTGSDAYLVDMDASGTQASNDYKPKIKIYKNDSDFNVNSSGAFDKHSFYEDTISNGSFQIGKDTVSFDLSAIPVLPTDVLTVYFGSDVSFSSDSAQPRWKATNDTLGTDVSIDYQLIVDSIYLEAIPATYKYDYDLDTTQHVFQSSGDFNVTLVTTNEDNYCTDTIQQLVHINQPTIYLSTSEPDETICLGDSVTFEAYSSTLGVEFEFYYNGVPQNTPSIDDTLLIKNNLANNDSISVLAYENGCVSDSMPQLIYVVNDLPVYTFVSDDANSSICAGDSVLFTGSSFDLSYDYLFLIDEVGVAFMDTIGEYTTGTLADSDVISLVVVDDNGCADTTSMTFNVNPLPTTSMIESTGGNVICESQLVTFTGSGADLYEFFLNDTTVQGPMALTTFSIDSLEWGDTITVMGSSSLGCNYMASESYTYIVNPIPSTTITSSDADGIICSGETVTFTSSGAAAYDFQINGVSVQYSGNASYITSSLNDNEIVEIIGHLGACSFASPQIIMTVLASPTTVLSNDDNGDNTICAGTSVTFTGSGAANYEFFIDGSSVQGPSAIDTYTTTGLLSSQTISVEGELNTCTVSQSQSFTILSNPSVSFFSNDVDNTICDGDGIVFTGANAANYEFFVNTLSSQGPSATSILTNPGLLIGSNAIQVVGTGGNGCTDTSAVIDLTVNAIPTLTMTSSDADDIICAGEQVTFTVNGGDMYQFYVDGTPQGAMSGTSTFTTFGLTDGEAVYFNGSLIGCASLSNSIFTTVNPIPSTSLTSTDVDNIYCADELIDYTSTGATNYEFIVNGISVQGPGILSTLNSSAFPTGSFDVEVIGEATSCSSSSILNVTINIVPTAALLSSDVDNIICQGESITYTASGGSLYEFFLNGGSQGSLSPTVAFSSISLIDNDVVSVEVTSPQGCTNTDTYLPITVNPTPNVVLTSSDLDNIICLGDNVDFTASGATLYEFFINDVSQGAPSVLTTISTTGLANFDIIEVVGDSLGCSSTSNNLTFTVYGAPVVTLTNNADTSLCAGELTDLLAGGATNYQLVINGTPIGGFSPGPNFNTALNDGDVVTINGETNACISTSMSGVSYTVFAYPTIASSINTAATICLNDLVTFTASGAMTYDFDINGAVVQSGPLTTFDVNTLSNSDVVTVTGYNGDCASTPDVYNFIVNSMNLDMTVTASSMICAGENATFTANGANEYEFFLNGVSQGPLSTNDTYSSSTLNDLDEFTYTGYSTLTLCTQPFSDYILMNVIDEPTITAMSNLSFCEGDSVILVSNLEYGNQWYVDGNPITGETDTSYVAYSSGSYSLDVTSGGSADVWSFGQNATGTFGNGSNLNSAEPTTAVTTELFEQLSSGYDFVLGVTSTNEVYAWGENSSGQLGDGTFTSSNLPQLVPTLANIKTVATSESSSMAVDVTGNTFVWGNNNIGQLATGNTNVVNFPFANPALTNVDSIAGGKSHFVILRNDGTVWTVGENNNGQLGQGNLTNSMNAIQVPGLTNIISVGAGEYQSFAIDNNGNLYVWGNNGSGQLGLDDLTNRLDPTLSPLENVINAQGGAAHSAFLTSDEKVFTAGDNSFGQLGTGNFTNSTVVIQVGVSGADMISTGQYTTLVKRADMSVFGFGNNTEDQLSLTGLSVNTPEHIIDLDGVSFIEASKSSSHVIYSTTKLCSSQDVLVNMLTTPLITITAVNDLLSAISGTSYQWYFNGNPIPGETNQTMIATQTGDYTVEVTFANGCTGVSDVYFFSMVSIENLTFENVNVFPNPTNGLINIQLTQELNELTYIEITDQAGRLVKEVEFNNGNLLTINVSELENGIYHVLIQNTSVSGNIRFIKSTK